MISPETTKPLRSYQLLSGFLPVEKPDFLVRALVSAGIILAETTGDYKSTVQNSDSVSVAHTLPKNRASLLGNARWNKITN